jgi:hypothetical protein
MFMVGASTHWHKVCQVSYREQSPIQRSVILIERCQCFTYFIPHINSVM